MNAAIRSCRSDHRLISRFMLTAILTLTSLAVLVATASSSTKYEPSIYSSTPPPYWAIVALLGSIGAVSFLHLFRCANWNRLLLVTSAASLLLFRLLILYTPVLRGYATWSGDHLSNLGHVVDLLSAGHLGAQNPYPASHTLLAQTVLLAGAPAPYVSLVITPVFSIFCVIGAYMLASIVFTDRRVSLITFVVSCVVIFNDYDVFFRANGWAFMLSPFLLYVFVKSRSSLPYAVLLVPFLIVIPFIHPLGALALAASFLIIALVHRKRQRSPMSLHEKHSVRLTIIPALVMIAIVIPWNLAFYGFQRDLRGFVALLTIGGESTPAANIGDILARAGIGGLDAIVLFFKWFGDESILFALFVIAATVLFRKRYSIRKGLAPWLNSRLYLAVCLIILLSAGMYLVYFLGLIPGLNVLGMERSQRFLTPFLPVAAAPVAAYPLLHKRRRVVAVLVVGTIVASSTGAVGAFHSPWILRPNAQVTDAQFRGSSWLFDSKTDKLGIFVLLTEIRRFSHFTFGVEGSASRPDTIYAHPIPDDFGYHEVGGPRGFMTSGGYIIVSEYDKVAYLETWRSAHRFSEDSFALLERDSSVQFVYMNGDTSIYMVAIG